MNSSEQQSQAPQHRGPDGVSVPDVYQYRLDFSMGSVLAVKRKKKYFNNLYISIVFSFIASHMVIAIFNVFKYRIFS